MRSKSNVFPELPWTLVEYPSSIDIYLFYTKSNQNVTNLFINTGDKEYFSYIQRTSKLNVRTEDFSFIGFF